MIANNIQNGIQVESGDSNSIRGNSIDGNGLLGIDLLDNILELPGVSPNDPGDADGGGNKVQNYPEIGSVATTGGSVVVNGSLHSMPGAVFDVDFYSVNVCDASGHGEGAVPLGSTSVTTDGSGDAGFGVVLIAGVPDGGRITATATDIYGDTSEFSACATATGVPPGAVSGVAFGNKASEALVWDATPGATQYKLYAGTRSTQPALLTPAADSCLAGVAQGSQLPLAPAADPPVGSLIWFLVTAQGPYGEGPVQPASNTPRQLTSVGPCGAACVHDVCAPGNPLVPACDLCASIVCDADPNCCTNAWDAVCVKAVRTTCRSLHCPDSQGQCAHSLCQEGGPLSPGCDMPPLAASCTAAICQADPRCCQQTWDAACIDKVSSVCGYDCL